MRAAGISQSAAGGACHRSNINSLMALDMESCRVSIRAQPSFASIRKGREREGAGSRDFHPISDQRCTCRLRAETNGFYASVHHGQRWSCSGPTIHYAERQARNDRFSRTSPSVVASGSGVRRPRGKTKAADRPIHRLARRRCSTTNRSWLLSRARKEMLWRDDEIGSAWTTSSGQFATMVGRDIPAWESSRSAISRENFAPTGRLGHTSERSSLRVCSQGRRRPRHRYPSLPGSEGGRTRCNDGGIHPSSKLRERTVAALQSCAVRGDVGRAQCLRTRRNGLQHASGVCSRAVRFREIAIERMLLGSSGEGQTDPCRSGGKKLPDDGDEVIMKGYLEARASELRLGECRGTIFRLWIIATLPALHAGSLRGTRGSKQHEKGEETADGRRERGKRPMGTNDNPGRAFATQRIRPGQKIIRVYRPTNSNDGADSR